MFNSDGLSNGETTTVMTYRLTNGSYEFDGTIPVTLAVGIPTSNDSEERVVDAFALHPPSPNPATGVVTLHYEVAAPERIHLAAYDMLGRELALVEDAPKPVGRHEAVLDASTLAAGLYLIRMTAGAGFTRTHPLVIVR